MKYIVLAFGATVLFSGVLEALLHGGTVNRANSRRVMALAASRLSLGSAFDLVIWDCDGVLVDSEALLKGGADALAVGVLS